MADENGQEASENGQAQRQVALQKIYIRDASIEVPDGPRVFTEQYQPEVNVDLKRHEFAGHRRADGQSESVAAS